MTIAQWLYEHWLEVFGALAGIIYVLLEIRQNIWLWPVGIITSAVYIIVFFTSKFYADMSLQVYYLVISFYGWYIWRYGSEVTPGIKGHSGVTTAPATAAAAAKNTTEDAAATTTTVPETAAAATAAAATATTTATTTTTASAAAATATTTAAAATATVQEKAAATTATVPETAAATAQETADTEADNASSGFIKTSDSVPLRVSNTPRALIIRLIVVYLLLHTGIWYILANFTDSPVAGWDSFTTALSVLATWMLARKYIEHWIIWILVNIVSLILYIYKGLYPTTVLFLVYTAMAFIGYREWRKDLKDVSLEPQNTGKNDHTN